MACELVGHETELVKKIKYQGLDPHQATADVVTEGGTPLTRKRAKNGNFATLYGSGYDTLAATIGSTRAEAIALKQAIFKAAPEINLFIQDVMNNAASLGYVRGPFGRRSQFPNPNFLYKAPNSLIQGGTADVNKFALNEMDEYLLDKRSKLALTIHDENPTEIHESELATVPRRLKEIMESIYPAKYLPLTAGMEYSYKSLGDKVKGFPV
jgi:DNA polymerase I-like protein with 3'-5' exonuclease and polymerase domains